MKILVVGRHVPEGMPNEYDVVGAENVTFSLDVNTCINQLKQLDVKAAEVSADAVVLQNTPGIVSAALLRMAQSVDESFVLGYMLKKKWGVIVSVPGERRASETRVFVFDKKIGDELKSLIEFANPRAKTEIEKGNFYTQITIMLEPVSPFVFDHIEWFK